MIWTFSRLAVLAAVFLMRFFRALRRSWVHDGDVLERIRDEGGEERERPRLSRLFGPLSERERIRRLYYKTVRRHIRRGLMVGRADTTGRICEKIGRREDIGRLTELYDEARYGDE